MIRQLKMCAVMLGTIALLGCDNEGGHDQVLDDCLATEPFDLTSERCMTQFEECLKTTSEEVCALELDECLVIGMQASIRLNRLLCLGLYDYPID